MKRLKTLILLLFLSTNILAQEVEIPKDIKLEDAEDYKKTEHLVLRSIDFLQKTSVSKDLIKRKEINAFLVKWITGSPTVTIELTYGIIPGDCPDCLISFMNGWTKYCLENNYSKNIIDGAFAGAGSAIDFYEKNKSELGRNSDMEKLIKQKKKGKLKKFIESKYSVE